MAETEDEEKGFKVNPENKRYGVNIFAEGGVVGYG